MMNLRCFFFAASACSLLVACSPPAPMEDASNSDASPDVTAMDAREASAPDGSSMDAVAVDTGPTCGAGQILCSGQCVSTQSDRANCGACGMACPAGQICAMGACATSCPMGQTECSGQCVNTQSDRANCGMCGTACPSGQVCNAGMCATSCPVGQTACSGACVNTMSDATHCGACGMACPSGQVCNAGMCELRCPSGQSVCGGACVNTQNDPANCGACGTACAMNELCAAGTCVRTGCPMGQTVCTPSVADAGADGGDASADGAVGRAYCADTNNDPNNCGACATVCPSGPNQIAVCAAGACRTVCATNFTDCDGNAANGCEANTSNDVNNCGRCGTVCPLPANFFAPACTMGTCGASTTCQPGRGDCDMMAANGCETRTSNNDANCGACGTVCPMGQSCSAGMCRTPTEGELRLVAPGANPLFGRVEVYHSGVWGSVCDDAFTSANAAVICRQLGLTGGAFMCCAAAGSSSGPIHLDDVSCVGTEARLVDCTHPAFGVNNCSHAEDVAVTCTP
ncbi:MAG: MXAN_6577-like cysteine-rich protein [Polyangiales bacterium]